MGTVATRTSCERIKCDLFYIENWNLLLEFQILLMTFFRRDNAC